MALPLWEMSEESSEDRLLDRSSGLREVVEGTKPLAPANHRTRVAEDEQSLGRSGKCQDEVARVIAEGNGPTRVAPRQAEADERRFAMSERVRKADQDSKS